MTEPAVLEGLLFDGRTAAATAVRLAIGAGAVRITRAVEMVETCPSTKLRPAAK